MEMLRVNGIGRLTNDLKGKEDGTGGSFSIAIEHGFEIRKIQTFGFAMQIKQHLKEWKSKS